VDLTGGAILPMMQLLKMDVKLMMMLIMDDGWVMNDD